MNASAPAFLHILVFQCPQCGKPIVESLLSPMRSLESIDSARVDLKCSCGWSDRRLGAQARRHFVLPWSPSDEPSAPGGQEGGGEENREEDTLNTL
jgi:hypothetical protein